MTNGSSDKKSKLAKSFPYNSVPADGTTALWISAYTSPADSSNYEMFMVMTKLSLNNDPGNPYPPVLLAYDSEARTFAPCPAPCALDADSVNNAWLGGKVSSVATSISSSG